MRHETSATIYKCEYLRGTMANKGANYCMGYYHVPNNYPEEPDWRFNAFAEQSNIVLEL